MTSSVYLASIWRIDSIETGYCSNEPKRQSHQFGRQYQSLRGGGHSQALPQRASLTGIATNITNWCTPAVEWWRSRQNWSYGSFRLKGLCGSQRMRNTRCTCMGMRRWKRLLVAKHRYWAAKSEWCSQCVTNAAWDDHSSFWATCRSSNHGTVLAYCSGFVDQLKVAPQASIQIPLPNNAKLGQVCNSLLETLRTIVH